MIEMAIDLPVPYLSQKDDEVMEKYGRKGCVFTSTRMVLAYYGIPADFEPLYYQATQLGAYSEEKGWIHSALVSLAREHGLKGYRIHYGMLDDADLKNVGPILAKEGASLPEIQEFEKNFNLARKKGRLVAIDHLVENRIPVIASMETTYAGTTATHGIVIKGEQDGKYIIQDPWEFGPDYLIDKQEFDRHWTKRAIVIFKNLPS